jgi:integrase
MTKENFNDPYVRNLKYTGDGKTRKEVKMEGPGLGAGLILKIAPGGTKSFYYRYMKNGKRNDMPLDVYSKGKGGVVVPLATIRKKYLDAYNVHAAGGDPLSERKAKEVKVQEEKVKAKDDWDFNTLLANFEADIKVHTPKGKGDMSAGHLKKILRTCRKDFAPAFKGEDGKPGTKKIRLIQPKEILDVLGGIKRRTVKGVQSNRAKAHLSRVMGYACESKMVIPANPCGSIRGRVKEYPKQNNELKPDQIKKLWMAMTAESLDNMTGQMRRALLLTLVTGLRPGEVLSMHSDMLELRPGEMDTGQTRHWLYIPDTKTHEPNRLYLTDLALELIGDKKGFIFQGQSRWGISEDRGIATGSLDTALSRKIERLGLAKFTPHDLRHTASTLLADLKIEGLSDATLMLIMPQMNDIYLNHCKRGMSKVYNHGPYLDLKKLMAEAVERRIREIIGKPSAPTAKPSTPAKVIPIGQRKAA